MELLLVWAHSVEALITENEIDVKRDLWFEWRDNTGFHKSEVNPSLVEEALTLQELLRTLMRFSSSVK